MVLPGNLTRIHSQQLLSHETPLTTERRGQYVAEEPLTLSRNDVRCLPFVFWRVVFRPITLHLLRGGGTEGRTWVMRF